MSLSKVDNFIKEVKKTKKIQRADAAGLRQNFRA